MGFILPRNTAYGGESIVEEGSATADFCDICKHALSAENEPYGAVWSLVTTCTSDEWCGRYLNEPVVGDEWKTVTLMSLTEVATSAKLMKHHNKSLSRRLTLQLGARVVLGPHLLTGGSRCSVEGDVYIWASTIPESELPPRFSKIITA